MRRMIKFSAAWLTIVLFCVAWVPAAMSAEAKLVGSSTVENQADSSSPGTAEAFSYVATASGITETAHLYIGASNAAKTVAVGIYSNVGVHPGTLLGAGSSTATPAGTWTSVPIGRVAITSGSTYWLAILGEGGTLDYRDHARGTCASEASAQSGLTAFASTWKSGASYKDCPGSVYVTAGAPPSPPVNTGLPVISGADQEGKTLTLTTGAWSGSPTGYAYQWQDCNALGEGCLSIAGAKALSYTLTAGDVGGTVRAVVTATNAGGSASANSAVTAEVLPPAAPSNTALPVVSGSDVEGQTLSASNGSWSGSPTGYAYQWQDCNALGEGCANIEGTTSSSYVPTALNVGGTARIRVTASNLGGATSATSPATPVIKAVAAPPPGESVLLLGAKVPHKGSGDSKAGEITPLKVTAQKSGTVEEICFETGSYVYLPSETSLVLGIQEDNEGKPGKVLGQGTLTKTFGENMEAKVVGLKVPITGGKTYFLSFLPLGGSVTYWFQTTETVIYSENHVGLEDQGPPESYKWKEEAAEAPIGIWANGT
jgi:hypothetical protein